MTGSRQASQWGSEKELERIDITEVLGSKTRLKIITALSEDLNSWSSVYAVGKKTGLNNKLARDALEKLVDLDWIEKLQYGLVRKYRLNLSNERARLFREFLHSI